MNAFIRRLVLSLSLMAAVGVVCAQDADTPKKIVIAAGSLVEALDKLTVQSGVQIMYEPDLAEGIQVAGVNGMLSVRDALQRLLAETGLKAHRVNEKTMVLKRANSSSQQMGPAAQMRVAVVETEEDGGQTTQAVQGEKNTQQVVVEGQRDRPPPFSTANLDLTRTEDDVLPFQVFTAREIELSGTFTLQEFLRERLPQNFSTAIPEEEDGAADNTILRINQVDMRGWGAQETVFLLNGRRMPNEYQGILSETSNATPSLRAIPLAAIERIEVLSSAGSAIYGANATGGVINIVTRQDFRGGQWSMSYATPADVNAPKRDVQVSYGFALHPRVSVNLHAGYSDSQPLRVGDRSDVTIERWRRREGISSDGRIPSSPYAAKPNIRAVSTITGDLFPDIDGLQRYAHPVAGYAGGGGLEDFEPGVNLELAEGTAGNSKFAKGSYLGPETASVNLSLGMQISLNERWRWFIDSRYAKTDSKGRPSAVLSFLSSNPAARAPRVPLNAAINPFGQDVQVYLVDPRLDRPEIRNKPNTTTWTLNTTLNGHIGEWRGFFDLSYSHNRNRLRSNIYWEPDGGWLNAFLTGQYNPFVDVTQVAPASPEFYENYTVERNYYGSATRNYAAGIKVSGPLFQLPAKPAQLTVGLDASRNDRYQSFRNVRYEDAATGAARAPVGTSPLSNDDPSRRFVFDSYAGYAEITAPLISASQGVPLARELEIFGSGRLEYTIRDGFLSQSLDDQQNGVPPQPLKYTHSTYLYALGFKYQLIEGITFRASRSIGFRPPSFQQVTPADSPTQDCCSGAMDPVRDEQLTLSPDMYRTGGNPNLRPETTDSTNVGVILMPMGLPNLRVSVDYIENTRTDAIFSFSASRTSVEEALSLENEFHGLISRDPPDGHPSGVGPVRLVDLRYRNLRQISSKSIDFNIAYQLGDIFGGLLSLATRASKNLSFKVQNSNTGPEEEQIRSRTSFPGARQIAWNANGQLRWDGQRWGFGWNTRYFDYLLIPTAYIDQQGSDRAPWKLNHDINVSYRPPGTHNLRSLQGFLSGTSITFTVQNLFNREPRFWYPSTDYGVAPGDSIAGRTWTLGVRKDL